MKISLVLLGLLFPTAYAGTGDNEAAAASVCAKLKSALPDSLNWGDCVDSPAGARIDLGLNLEPDYPNDAAKILIEKALEAGGVNPPLKVAMALGLEFDVCETDSDHPMKFSASLSEESLGLESMKIFEIKGDSNNEVKKTFNSPITIPPAPAQGIIFVVFVVTMSGDSNETKIKLSVDLLTKYPSTTLQIQDATLYSQVLFDTTVSFKAECDKNHENIDCFKTTSPTNVNGKGSVFDTCLSQSLVRSVATAGKSGGSGGHEGMFFGALFLGLFIAGAGGFFAIRKQVLSINGERVKELKDQVKELKAKAKGKAKESMNGGKDVVMATVDKANSFV